MANESVIGKSKVHVPKLVLTKHVQHVVHGDSCIGRINTRIAVKITEVIVSMWCAQVFALFALILFPTAINSHDPIIIVA